MKGIDNVEDNAKTKFLINLFNPKPYQLDIIEIDLDSTDLGIADVLRNVNTTLPVNSRDRNSIASGFKVLGILCKSKLLAPMSGILIFLVGDNVLSKVSSKKYIAMTINEKRIRTDKELAQLIDEITMYMISVYKNNLANFQDFYAKFIFDDYEDDFYTY